MVLYRVIGLEELACILKGQVVMGRFTEETRDNGYKKEYGPVVCCFTRPVSPSCWVPFMIELDVDETQIKGQGIGHWSRELSYGQIVEADEPEVYLSHYTPEQVRRIYPLHEVSVAEEVLTFSYDSYEDLVFYEECGILNEKDILILETYRLAQAGGPKFHTWPKSSWCHVELLP